MRTGVIDVGGGERGIYGAGVFDRCIDEHVHFDYCIGVSAGAANIASFLAGQKKRNYKFYTEYSFRKEYMGWKAFLHSGSYLDLEYIYGDALSNSCGEYPLGYDAMLTSGSHMEIVATDAHTGEPVYYKMQDMAQDDYGAIKGSSCIPIAARPYLWKGRLLYDGGLSDPIPVARAFAEGCEKVVLVLTRPQDDVRDPSRDRKTSRLLKLTHKKAGEALEHRADTYNKELSLAKDYERLGKLLIVAPDDIGSMKTLTKDLAIIRGMYDKGYRDAATIKDFLKA